MIDVDRIKSAVLELLAIPSPCGFTDEIVHCISRHLTEMGIEHKLTRRGTVQARIPGKVSAPARAIVTHVDTYGAMVRMLRDDGRILIAPIGHWSSRFAEGCKVNVFTEKSLLRGTILPSVEWGVSRDQGVEAVPFGWDHVELRLEEAVYSADDLRELGVEPGNFIALDCNPEVLDNGYIVSRNLDNKAGTAAVLEMLRHMSEENIQPSHDTYVLFTITETTGAGIGSAIMPEVSELVTVDFASVKSREKSPFKRITLASGDASGPYDYHLTAHLYQIATEAGIPFQRRHLKAYHSDAAAALIAGHDVRTAVVAYAGDASHSIERTHIESLENLAQLLMVYCVSKPTFASDDAVTTAKDFSHQIDSERLPARGEVPDMAAVIGAQARKDPDDDA